MIPEEKCAAVSRGLRKTFGVSSFDDATMLTKGQTSSLVFRIVVGKTPFLMKIIMREGDCSRHFTNMNAAADAGLAPRVLYANVEDRVLITEFVEAVPFPAGDALAVMPRVLRKLHSLAPFPSVADHLNTTCLFLLSAGPAVEGFVRHFQSSGLLNPDERAQFLAWHTQLVAAYPRHEPEMVPSHNDLFKPDNILFDGRRPWLIDWEAAFQNDRYADLAVLANLIVNDAAEEQAYLREYFGNPPNEYQMARYFLMQQLVHMFYTMAFLLPGPGGEQVAVPEERPGFRTFKRQMWAGEVDLKDKATRRLYGRMHWDELVRNMRSERLNEALRIVG